MELFSFFPDHVRNVLIGGAAADTFWTTGGSTQDTALQTDLFWNFQLGHDTIGVMSNDHNLGLGATFVANIPVTTNLSGTELYNGNPNNPVAFLVGEDLTVAQLSAAGSLELF
jgi:hypothetical protein